MPDVRSVIEIGGRFKLILMENGVVRDFAMFRLRRRDHRSLDRPVNVPSRSRDALSSVHPVDAGRCAVAESDMIHKQQTARDARHRGETVRGAGTQLYEQPGKASAAACRGRGVAETGHGRAFRRGRVPGHRARHYDMMGAGRGAAGPQDEANGRETRLGPGRPPI